MAIQQNARADKTSNVVVHPTPGIGDTTTIADALALLPADGGTIYVREGTYAVPATLDFGSKVVRLVGAGHVPDFITGPTTLVPAAGITLFSSTADNSSIEDMVITGDNSTAQVLFSGSTEIRFIRVNVHDVAGIISGTPDAYFYDSFVSVPSGPSVGDRFLWSGGAAGGTLVFDNVELRIFGSGATIMSGVTASQNGPTFKAVNSYTGGGGGGGSTNFWFAEIVDWVNFDIDNAQFEISNSGSNIVNCEFLDFSIKFLAIWNFIANSNFSQGGTGSGLFSSQLEIAPPVSFAGTPTETLIVNCNFYGNSASITGVTVTNAFPVVISNCIFSNHTSRGIFAANGTSPNASQLSVTGCHFDGETTPVEEGGTDVVGRYCANENFAGSTILGPNSTIEGTRRKDTTSTTTDSFVELFTHVNYKGIIGIGTIKNTDGTDSLDIKETVTDVFGVTTNQTNTVANGASRLLDPTVNVSTARPPYVSYKVEVKSTSAGNPATFEMHHISNGVA